MQNLKSILSEFEETIKSIKSSSELEALRVKNLGKSGIITSAMSAMKTLSHEEKKAFGQEINQVKQTITLLIQEKSKELELKELEEKLQSETVDITLPGKKSPRGSLHPISKTTTELIEIFARLGFDFAQGPDIELPEYNFTLLNIPENHPARQMHDTFYLENEKYLLRTHTSPVQIRKMQNSKPPFRFISPGRVYRSDHDMTHTPMFHQIEGVVVDENINMGNLKHTLLEFIKLFFNTNDVELRMRPSFFPFTEPSAEVDIRFKGQDKWLEVLGSGMIHPKVLENVNIDAQKYRGFAFGLGIDRFAMLKYGIKDLRDMFDTDVRILKQYGFSALEAVSLSHGF